MAAIPSLNLNLSLSLALSPPLITALRFAPLVGATASLTHAYMEYVTTTCFLTPARTNTGLTRSIAKTSCTSTPANADAAAAAHDVVIPIWFTNFFNKGLYSVIGFNTLTTTSALANLFLFPDGLGEARLLYSVGLGAAAAHYLFVPGVAGSVEKLFKACVSGARGEGEVEKGSAVKSLREWVGVHRVRMWTVDVAAWTCFVVAVVKVFTP